MRELLDEGGFFTSMEAWSPSAAEALAKELKIGPLEFGHWKVIEYLRWYHARHGTGPVAVKVHKDTGLNLKEISRLFPCGLMWDAYRLAGLPHPGRCG